MKHFYYIVATAALALLPTAASARLYGNIPDEATLIGIPTDGSQTFEEIYTNEDYMVANGGGVWADGKYYVLYLDNNNPYIVYSCLSGFAFDGETVSRKSSRTFYDEEIYIATDLTYDEIGKKVYGVFTYYEEDDTHFFGSLNTDNGKVTRIAADRDWVALACDALGKLYALGTDGTLYTVDTANGNTTTIGQTGLVCQGKASATIDPASGICYLSIKTAGNPSSLYTIDLATATPTLITNYPGGQEVTGLFTISSNENAAPAPVSNLSADFAGESLSGIISFDAPSTLANGQPASGKMTYTLAANGELLATEETVCGRHVEVPVALAEAGEYTFEVKVSNSSAVSEATTLSLWVGPDTRYTLVPGFTASFASADDMDGYTVIDANHDNKTWKYYSNRLKVDYNSIKAMDDWLITPRIEMKTNMQYQFEINMSTSSMTERFEVMMGTEPAAAAMTEVIIAPTELLTDYNTPDRYTALLTVPSDGYYYIGIHGISDEDMDALYLHNFSLSAPTPLDNPAAPALDITADPSFALSAEVSVTAPDRGINGTPIAALDKIEICRDGTLIHTLATPVPSVRYTFTDAEGLTIGNHTYTATAYASGQSGATAEKTVYIGVAIPSAPLNADFVQTSPGNVTITWDAPETDEIGRPVNKDLITYTVVEVVDNKTRTIAEGLTEPQYSYEICSPTAEQNLYYYGITASTQAGESDYCRTDHKPVGEAYTLPFAESFPGGNLSHVFGSKRLEGVTAAWKVVMADAENPAQDNDGGMVAMSGSYPGEKARISSGNINLTGAAKPVFSFWYRSVGPDCGNTLDILADNGSGYDSLSSLTLSSPEGWTYVEIPLSGYIGNTIRFALDGSIITHTAIAADNLRVADADSGVSEVTQTDGSITTAPGRITITTGTATPVTLCDTAGRVVFSGTVDGTRTIEVINGIYAVRMGSTAHRIIVK